MKEGRYESTEIMIRSHGIHRRAHRLQFTRGLFSAK